MSVMWRDNDAYTEVARAILGKTRAIPECCKACADIVFLSAIIKAVDLPIPIGIVMKGMRLFFRELIAFTAVYLYSFSDG